MYIGGTAIVLSKVIRKSRMKREFHVRFCERVGAARLPPLYSTTFQISMLKNRNYLFPCIYNLDIPPDNNGSEQAIRNIKVKQKVSRQFKSRQDASCVIRSVIDTLRKRKVEMLPCLNLIIKLQPV